MALNLGLRWDYETPRVERYDRMVRGFALDFRPALCRRRGAPSAAANCPACSAGLTGGLLSAGGGNGRYALEHRRANFQPRLGIAYRITSKLVFRGGYALSYLVDQCSSGQATRSGRRRRLVASLDNGLTPAASLERALPGQRINPSGLLTPIGNTQGLSTNLGQSVTFQYLDRPLPYSRG